MKKFRFTSFSFTILITLLFSFVFFSCASKPAPETKIEQEIEAPSENIENVENKTLEENKEETSTENSENNNDEYKIDELDEIEVIDEPIVIDFFPIEEEEDSENNDSKNVEVELSDNIILEEKIEDFEELTPIEEFEKTEISIENKDLENSNNSDSQLIQENQKEENNLEATEVNPSTEQETETPPEENIENFPIIEVESEENQQDDTISQSELEILYANIVPSRKISIKLGEKILITYPGLNWKFYGITDNSKDVELIERNKIRTNTTFEFITKNSGIKILHFYKFDNVTQNYIDDFIEIEIISENSEDEVLDVSLLEEEKSNVEKTETKTVEAPKYKKVESAKKIGTKKQIKEENQNKEKTESKETDKIEEVQKEIEKEEKVIQNKVVKKLENSKVSKTSDEETNKNKVQKQVVQKKETEVKKSEEKPVETKTKEKATPEEENEESPSLSKSEIDDLLISAKKLYNEKKYKESLEKVNLFLELSVEKRDEALFLQGQLYESQSNVKNIKKALESYNSIISNYPSSKVWEDANKRIIYLNRFYLKGR